jgi:hypothetical protein
MRVARGDVPRECSGRAGATHAPRPLVSAVAATTPLRTPRRPRQPRRWPAGRGGRTRAAGRASATWHRRSPARRGHDRSRRRPAPTGCAACRARPSRRSAARRTPSWPGSGQQRGGDLLPDGGGDRARPDPVLLALGVVGGEDDPAGRDLGLVDRRYRLRVVGQAREHPGELEGVHRGHLRDRDVDVAPSCISSVRTDSVNPMRACLAPQYADCSGIERALSAEPHCTIVPRFRGRILDSATIVP